MCAKILYMKTQLQPAVDDILGRGFDLWIWTPPHGWVRHHIQIVGYDPERGWQIYSRTLPSEWIPLDMWRALEDQELVVPR